jgi:CheY-like chemotaxis protein
MGSAVRLLPERVVLVVDDEELVCRLTARVLTEAGFRVVEAHSGAQAVALLSTLGTAAGLVVSDIAMPSMSGVELAATMAERWPTVPILLVSGHGGPQNGYRGPFLAKPFTAEALLSAIASVLASSDGRTISR